MIVTGKASVSSSGRMRSFSFSARPAAKSSRRDFRPRLFSCELGSPVVVGTVSLEGLRNSCVACDKPLVFELNARAELGPAALLLA